MTPIDHKPGRPALPTIEEAFALIEALPPGVAELSGPVPEELVARAEAALGLRFPESYRAFLLRHGQGLIGPSEIYGLRPGEPEPELGILNVVTSTLSNRRYGQPHALVTVYNFGNGDDYVLDLSASGEPPVLAWNGGCGGDRTLMERIEGSFASFLLNVAEFALSDLAGDA